MRGRSRKNGGRGAGAVVRRGGEPDQSALISPYLLQMQISFGSTVPHQKYELNDNFIHYSYLQRPGRDATIRDVRARPAALTVLFGREYAARRGDEEGAGEKNC